MKKTILIIFIFISIGILAEEKGEKGKLDLSINASLSTGAGFGIAYNFTNRFRIKLTGLYINFYDDSNSSTTILLGGSLSYKLKTLKDQKSSLYLFLGTSNIINSHINENTNVIGLGLGLRKFFDSKMFWEVEIGYSNYFSYESNIEESITMPSLGFNIGYQF